MAFESAGDNVIMRKNHFYAKRLIQEALSGFYAFEDDEIEKDIERLWKKYNIWNFKYPADTRSRIRSELMSKLVLRDKICAVAARMFTS